MDYLKELAVRILQEVPDGLSKVKFAKVIYFTHKFLVINGQRRADDIFYIRMPLGPVPVGFMKLQSSEISMSPRSSALSFDTQVYSLNDRGIRYSDKEQRLVNKVMRALNSMNTSELVEASHLEPSWQKYLNGVKYCIENEDLAVPMPKLSRIRPEETLTEQHLQAKLVEGMLDDIVDESTLLEYPKDKSS